MLFRSETIPHTPSRTADWLEVAVGRFEAWKASTARLGARRALEFVRAWYPGLNLEQLRTWRLEADEAMEEVRRLSLSVPRRSPSALTSASSLLKLMTTLFPAGGVVRAGPGSG